MRRDSDFWDIGSIGAPATDEEMQEQAPLIVLMEDAPLHTEVSPFCNDPTCGCHYDLELLAQYIGAPLDNGLLTPEEAARLRYGKQV